MKLNVEFFIFSYQNLKKKKTKHQNSAVKHLENRLRIQCF